MPVPAPHGLWTPGRATGPDVRRSGPNDRAALADRSDRVYRPQADTLLLMEALGELPLRGARALDLCTGSGVVAVEAASRGARVTAIDSSPAAARAARAVSSGAGVEVDVLQVGVAEFRCTRGFDVITCNPPYVPTPVGTEDVPGAGAGPAEAWNAGTDGRAVLDVVCARLDELLSPTGTALIVQSAFADCDQTLAVVREAGLSAHVARRRAIPFGPVLLARCEQLRRAAVIPPDCHDEEIVVIRAHRPGGAR
ncbi:HemK2/MTQ2 family protein methyltransferase [Tsukamurella ocularis]|uniref:HemK2/MTQ2 family protein methyltransferase n=1 Tax=Tsukamurella ocularis TaxID=1970234 RepID=UPI0039F103A1